MRRSFFPRVLGALFTLLLLVGAGSCGGQGGDGADAHDGTASDLHVWDMGPLPTPVCARYGTPAARGTLPDVLEETSGICRSRKPGILWMHNDSGAGPFLHAVAVESGALVATVGLPLELAYDWEDISAGPCGPDGDERCLFVGDIGDGGMREGLGVPPQIHRIVEPDPEDGDQVLDAVETMALRYPDGVAHNAEALVSDSRGRIFVLTKDDGNVFRLFGGPFRASQEPVELSDYGEFDISSMRDGERTKVTAADYDPEHNRLLVRGWTGILEYSLPSDRDLTSLQGVPPRVLPCADEEQGEAVAYGDDGYYQVSEGENPPIYFVPCAI